MKERIPRILLTKTEGKGFLQRLRSDAKVETAKRIEELSLGRRSTGWEGRIGKGQIGRVSRRPNASVRAKRPIVPYTATVRPARKRDFKI
ncbi:hypothetical protein BH11ARM2_BH11ARM2_23270 [soil metagenome]